MRAELTAATARMGRELTSGVSEERQCGITGILKVGRGHQVQPAEVGAGCGLKTQQAETSTSFFTYRAVYVLSFVEY